PGLAIPHAATSTALRPASGKPSGARDRSSRWLAVPVGGARDESGGARGRAGRRPARLRTGARPGANREASPAGTRRSSRAARAAREFLPTRRVAPVTAAGTPEWVAPA